MKLLVLYEELAGYFIKCITEFSEMNNADVHIIHKEVNNEAPFNFSLGNIKTYVRSSYNDYSLVDLAIKLNADAVFCGGWSTASYLKIAAHYRKSKPVIIGFDNKWNGSLKQHLACLLAPFYITNKFTGCFVPGPEQKKYAIKMGFREDQVSLGAYSCDFSLFHNQYLQNREQKARAFPRRLIFVGRYVENKGIMDLWKAFAEIQDEDPNEWELWCLGTGPLQPFQHPKIHHFGFVQPDDLPKYIKKTGVFVLPSHFEPWGVVVHEFAASGFPVVCSDEVGARVTFVEDGFNGYIYTSGNVNALKSVLKQIMKLDQDSLVKLGDNSVEKAKLITPEIWSKQLMALL